MDLFTQHGYTGTSLDAVARRARVTKGALYHHFTGKQALFEAAFDVVETASMRQLTSAMAGEGAAWERALAGVREYIRICLDPAYQRLVINEAPVVMGLDRWREAENRYSFGVVRSVLEELVEAGEITEVPIEVTARMIFAALSAGATIIAAAEDPQRAGNEVFTALTNLIEGIRRKP